MITLSLAFLAYIAAVTATRSLEVKASAPGAVSDVDHLSVLTTITNTGDETLKLLDDPRSPLSSFATNKFVVVNSAGESPVFNGLHAAYSPHVVARQSQNESFFTLLGPGEFVEASHEVSRYYNFTYSGPGTYTFTPDNTFYVLEGDGSVSELKAVAIPATVDISGKLSSSKSLGLRSAEDTSPVANGRLQNRAFAGCQPTDSTILAAVASNADGACNRALNHVQANPLGSQLETTWFGPWTEQRHYTVFVTLQRLKGQFTKWKYDCGTCKQSGILGYINTGVIGTVYICSDFWDPKHDMNARVETIIHMGTHFPGPLTTQDFAFGEKNSLALAQSDPDKAVQNADNYGYFAVSA